VLLTACGGVVAVYRRARRDAASVGHRRPRLRGLVVEIDVANASYPTGSVTAYIKHADGNVAPV
jgi:hypothetical protein